MKGILFLGLLATLLLPISAAAGVYEDMLRAVNTKDLGTVVGLLQRGMDVNTSDSSGNSLLTLAAQTDDLPMLEVLLGSKANVLTRNKYGDSALMLAALRGHLRSVTALVAAGAEIDPEGWTPLIYAAFGGHAEIVRFLLKLDLDIDAQAENGMTALMAASRNGHLEVVKLLLEQDADMSLVNQSRLTALDMAARAGHKEVVRELSRVAGRKGHSDLFVLFRHFV